MIQLLGALVAAGAVTLPSALVNGRFFYEPTVGERRLRIWLDTDGDGFITRRCANALGLATNGGVAVLPPTVVGPRDGGRLRIFAPDPGDRIFEGIDAQFGTTWFAGRVVLLDYPRSRLATLEAGSRGAGTLGRAAMTISGGYAGVRVRIADEPEVEMSFDTAASVVLTPRATAAMHDGWGSVRATSFLTHGAVRAWHAAHPSWPYLPDAGDKGVDMIEVPRLTIGSYRTTNVWFSTRPDDDVFQGERAIGKIGPTAFYETAVTLDYPSSEIYFDP